MAMKPETSMTTRESSSQKTICMNGIRWPIISSCLLDMYPTSLYGVEFRSGSDVRQREGQGLVRVGRQVGWCVCHRKAERGSLGECCMVYPERLMDIAVDGQFFRVDLCGLGALGFQDQLLAVGETNAGAVEEGRAEDPGGMAGTERVDPQGAEQEPRGHLAVVFVSGKGVGRVEFVQNAVYPILGAVGATGGSKEVEGMVHRLIGVRVLAEVRAGHLRHLMDLEAVVPNLEVGRLRQHLLQFRDKGFGTAHQGDEPFGIVRNGPGGLPGTALHKGVAPAELRKGGPGAIGIAPPHKSDGGVVVVAVVSSALQEELTILLLAERPGYLRDAEVVVGVVEGARNGFVMAVRRNVALLQVVRDADAPIAASSVARLKGVLAHPCVGGLDIEVPHAPHHAIGNDRVHMRSHHAGAVAGAGPLGEPAALPAGLRP